MKTGSVVTLIDDNKPMLILRKDTIASIKLNTGYWICKIIGKNCVDSYPEIKLKDITDEYRNR